MRPFLLVATMVAGTALTRFLPFVVFRRSPPDYVSFLGRVLPSAIIAMLVVYCLREVAWASAPFGLPELLATACVVALQAWRRNSLLSILVGTLAYMLLIRL